jgi:hypothetical protein
MLDFQGMLDVRSYRHSGELCACKSSHSRKVFAGNVTEMPSQKLDIFAFWNGNSHTK